MSEASIWVVGFDDLGLWLLGLGFVSYNFSWVGWDWICYFGPLFFGGFWVLYLCIWIWNLGFFVYELVQYSFRGSCFLVAFKYFEVCFRLLGCCFPSFVGLGFIFVRLGFEFGITVVLLFWY